MDKQLRLIAGAIVTESKLSKGAKLQLLNFIQNEATDIQVKALLLDGEILTNIDKQTEQIINDRFKLKENKLLSEDLFLTLTALSPAILSTLASAAFLGYVMRGAYRVSKKVMTKAGRACKSYTGNELARCKAKFQKEALTKELQLLKQARSKCSKTKEPQKCVASIDQKIAQTKAKHDKIRV